MSGIKKTVIAGLLLVCLVLGAVPVMAEGNQDDLDALLGTVVDGSLLTDDVESEGIAVPKMKGIYLSNGTGHITIEGTRRVTVSGSTTAYQNVDEVIVTLYLQRLEDGNWEHVLKLGPRTKYGGYYVSNSNTYSVDGGYYYRVHGSHIVNEGGTSEAAISNTSGIKVN